MSAITVSNLSKQYQVGAKHYSLRDAIPALVRRLAGRGTRPQEDGTFWALKDVTFTVAPGETLGIIGRNGAGKSTILKLLSNITKPTTGSIDVRGTLAALIEVGAGFHPDLTGRENVFLNGTILGLKRREIETLFDQIVAFAELEPFIDTPVKRYSSGMYVRLGFAIAAHVNPDVLLIDEVLAVGDLAFQQKCLQRIHELKRQGKTILFISHNLNAVQRICDRAILLNKGEVVAQGEVGEAIKAYRERVVTTERNRFAKTLARTEDAGTSAGGVRIEGVQVYNRAGAVTESIRTGEPLTVEVRYRCARRVEHPTVKIGIDRLDGLVCHVASSQHAGVPVPPLEGEGSLRLTYPAISLLPHAYHVSVELSEQGRTAPLDSRKHGCFFNVSSDRHEQGAVHLEHRWEWNGAGGSR